MSISGSKRLIMAGFVTKKFKEDYPNWDTFDETKKKEILDKIESKENSEEKLATYADHDEIVIGQDQLLVVDYPKPANKYQVVYESPHSSIEPYYYFIYHHLYHSFGFPLVDKITDIFTASEHSSFYGAAAQRLGLAQDKVSQYMAAIGQFIRKDLFQLIRDLRWLDERIKIHKDAREYTKEGKLKDESAEITLKGLWTDLIDGVVQGQRVSANVFQMAQQLNFTSLPDFFFSMHPKNDEELNKMVEKLDTTASLKNVLRRKLKDYLIWKEANYKELQVRKNFELKYLRQHYNIINMYLQWVKPYMKHIAKLRGDIEKTDEAQLISAFEGSMIEIEILGQRLEAENKKVYTCILATMEYRTRPSLSYQQEAGFHRGPIHMGELKMTLRAYGWTKKQIEAYKKMKQKEDMEMFEEVSSGIKATMDAIKDDLYKYLEEAEGKKEEKKETKKPETIFAPFASLGKGFKDMFGMFIPSPKSPAARAVRQQIKTETDSAQNAAKSSMWLVYKIFKKAHKLLTW